MKKKRITDFGDCGRGNRKGTEMNDDRTTPELEDGYEVWEDRSPIDMALLPPGPWCPVDFGGVEDARGSGIVSAYGQDGLGGGQMCWQEAQMSRLIAAAPALLAEVLAGRAKSAAHDAVRAYTNECKRCAGAWRIGEEADLQRAYQQALDARAAARAAVDAAGVV